MLLMDVYYPQVPAHIHPDRLVESVATSIALKFEIKDMSSARRTRHVKLTFLGTSQLNCPDHYVSAPCRR
jgi:hypothetical protein